MKTLLLSLVSFTLATAVSAFAGQPCGVTYCKPIATHAPAFTPTYVPPVQTVPYLIPVPVPVQYEKPIALQGTTVYGYSTVQQIYGDVDLALLFDKAERLATQSQQLSSQATSGYLDLVNAERDRRAEAARITAASQAIAQVLAASKQADAGGNLQAQALTTATGVLSAKCASCHPKYANWDSLDAATKDSIFDRITHPDPAKRMPKADGGKSAGEALPLTERKLLVPK